MIPTILARLTDPALGLRREVEVWTTLEGENPGQSIKDRMVYPELLSLKQSTLISEMTAGSTGQSIAYYSKELGHSCHLFIPRNLDESAKDRLKRLHATLTECDESTAEAAYNTFLSQNNTFPFAQMKRRELKHHYENWSRSELKPQLPVIDAVLGSVGTGHSLIGISAGLAPGKPCIASEPGVNFQVKGIRNLNSNQWKTDTIDLKAFTERIEVSPAEIFSARTLETDLGPVNVSPSFTVALGAAQKLLQRHKSGRLRLFLVNANGTLVRKEICP